MTSVEVSLTLGYPDSLDTPAVQVALAQLATAVEAFEDVPLLSVSVQLIEETT